MTGLTGYIQGSQAARNIPQIHAFDTWTVMDCVAGRARSQSAAFTPAREGDKEHRGATYLRSARLTLTMISKPRDASSLAMN